jgi:lipopolysaccharide transport protein LptA
MKKLAVLMNGHFCDRINPGRGSKRRMRVASPFARERGRVRAGSQWYYARSLNPSPRSSPLAQGKRRNVATQRVLFLLILFIACAIGTRSAGQIAASPGGSPAPAKKAEKPAKEKAKNKEKKKEDKSSGANLFGPGTAGQQSNEPTTTEIYSDEAFFDSTKNMGIFSGRVKVVDPRFNLQSDKLTVFITKGQSQSLEKAIAEGNVGLIRDRPDANGGPPTRAVGRADKATYIAATGDVELAGTPRVQEGPNMHVATSPDTVMVISQNSQLRTHGPSRTEIVQQPNDEKKGQASPSQTPAAQASPASPAPSLPKP